MSYKFVSFIVIMFVLLVNHTTVFADTSNPSPVVWQSIRMPIRDPELFKVSSSAAYVLTGTGRGVIEFPNGAPDSLNPLNGTPFFLGFYTPDGLHELHPAQGFYTWNNVFQHFSDGPKMLAALPTVPDFNALTATTAAPSTRRSTYLFVPMGTRTTVKGFPLDWRMASNTPVVPQVYAANPYFDKVGNQMYLESDVRKDVQVKATCMLGQELWSGVRPNSRTLRELLCPGRPVATTTDITGFDRLHPLSSEVRFPDGGGLVEGGWFYYSAATQKYYLLYSSGDYSSPDEYGGYVAVCDTPTGPCKKVMNQSNSEARRFVAGSSKNYTAIGRPFPIIDGRTGVLTDVIFHARRASDNAQVILRCTNTTSMLLEDFVTGGRSCEFDTPATSTEVMMRIVLDYATSSGADTHHGKGIKLADAAGTVLRNGEWFPITQGGVTISDPTYVAALPDRNEFPGILVARKNGAVTIGQFSSSTDVTDYEITDGYIEVRNATVSTSTDPSMFIELYKFQRTRYVDTRPSVYDYMQNTAPNVIAFGLLGSGLSTDRFTVTVTPDLLRAQTVSAAVIEASSSVLSRLIIKLQELISRL